MTKLLKKLIPLDELKRTIRRFPIAALCSLVLFVLLVLGIHDIIDFDDKAEVYGRLMLIAAYGFLWFVLARLIVEGKQLEGKKGQPGYEYILGFSVFALLVVLIFGELDFSLAWMLALMIPALLLGISVGPYISSSDNLSFWFYNRQLWQGVAIAILAGLLWGGGLSAALASIDYLFGADIEGEFYADLWSFALIVFAPLYALSWVPEQYQYTEQDCHAPPQLAFVLNWVLAPLIVVYILILYAYFIKIALVQELPRGQLSYMVTAFGGLGVLTYMAGWSLRETGGPLLKLVVKLFFPALLIPVVMQALSIYLRIGQYGITEQRFVVALSALWFGVLAVAYTLKKPPLKIISGLLAVLLLIAALGPFSAPKISERSQLNRLENLLRTNGIMVDGTIGKTGQEISFEDRKSISSILSFLQQRKKLDRIEPWLPDEAGEKIASNPNELTKHMGFAYISHYQRRQHKGSEIIHLQGKTAQVVEISGFDYLIPTQYVNCYKTQCSVEKPWQHNWNNVPAISASEYNDQPSQAEIKPDISISYQNGQLTFSVEDQGALVFDVQAFINEEIAKDTGREPRELVMEKNNGNLRARVIFKHANTTPKKGKFYRLQSFAFTALIDYQ